MKYENDDKWLESLLSRHIQREPLKFDLGEWAEKYPDEGRLLRHGFEDFGWGAKTTIHNIWRFMMESKVTKYSAAAVIFVALLLILVNPFGISNHGGVALADVERKVAKIGTFVIHGKRVFTSLEDPNQVHEFDVIKYVSLQHGYREEQYEDDELMYRISVSFAEKLGVVIFPGWQKYLKYPLNDKQIEMLDKLCPKGIVGLFRTGEYKELGAAEINDVNAEGFEIRDVRFMPGIPKVLVDINDITLRLWVGVDSSLPVQVDADMKFGKCLFTNFKSVHLDEVDKFVEYDVELDAELFEPNIPADYKPLDFNLLSSLKNAKGGLLGVCMIPAGFIIWRRFRRKRTRANQH